MHPLSPDLSGLSDEELQKKLGELQKRYLQSSRMGSFELTAQLGLLIEDYQWEISERNRQQMEKMQQRMNNKGQNFDGIIDIE